MDLVGSISLLGCTPAMRRWRLSRVVLQRPLSGVMASLLKTPVCNFEEVIMRRRRFGKSRRRGGRGRRRGGMRVGRIKIGYRM